MYAVDRESVTQLYVRAAPAGPTSSTQLVEKVRANAVGIGFLATCTALGVLVGVVIALRGSATASPAIRTPATPVVISVEPIAEPPPAPPARPVVAPMAEPVAAPAEPVAVAVPAPVTIPAPVTATATAARRHHHDRTALAASTASDAAAPSLTVTTAASGTLRVSAKPPCAIAVDDKPTGLTTPQATITLTAGHHEVTLTNAEQGIQLTADVEITADHTTPLIEDFTK